jgi:hypothetical protein
MTALDELIADLPASLPTSPDTNIYAANVPVANAIEATETDIASVKNAVAVQTAESIDQLAELAKLVGVRHEGDDSLETFRLKTLGAFQLLTCGGTRNEIIKNAAEILNVSPEAFEYSQQTPGQFSLNVPGDALTGNSLESADFADILQQQAAAGFRLDVSEAGTLRYITEAEYLAGDYDPTKGYDSLTGDGNGGTYSGLL